MAESTGGVQPYKYNGKELDRMHGLDSYDYGARWMSDGRFCTPDPHAINYVGVSPYAYCENNPMNAIDKNGEDSYYLTDGTYICDNLKETDHIYVVSNYNYLKQLPNGNRVVEFYGKQSLEEAKLSANAFSNIFTNVLKRNGFDVDKLENKSIAVNVLDNNTKGDGPHYRCIDFYNTTSYPWKNAGDSFLCGTLQGGDPELLGQSEKVDVQSGTSCDLAQGNLFRRGSTGMLKRNAF